jgi:membrane associated rhomboid family serine protease
MLSGEPGGRPSAGLGAERDEAFEPATDGPQLRMIGPLTARRLAREWALVLQSQHVGYVMSYAPPTRTDDGQVVRPGGWVLTVSPGDYDRAVQAIDLYEAENEDWPPEEVRDTPRHEASLAMPLAFALLALFFFYVTGPAARGSMWFLRGRADAALLLSEPWRMITALTLHADPQHIVGNALSGSIFGLMVSRRIGGGGALLAVLVTGIVGNTLNAVHHLPGGHRSIGASTAVFGAVGILAALQTVIDWGRRREARQQGGRRRYRAVDVVAPIIGGLALLGSLGAGGGNTDVWAHGYGFLAGVGIGVVLGLVVRRQGSQPSGLVQGLSVAAASLIVGGAWLLAIL